MTARGIEYNLPKSPYVVEMGNFKFFFSSKRYLETFTKGLLNYTREETDKYKQKWGFSFISIQHTFEFYKVTEKRGFYIEWEGKPICQKLILSIGEVQTKKR